MASGIQRTDPALIQEKHDLAARAFESWPTHRQYRFLQALVTPANIVGPDHFGRLEDGANLSIQRVESLRRQRFRSRHTFHPRPAVLIFDQHKDRQMPGMRLGPLANRA